VYTLAAQELQKFLHIYYFVLLFLEIYPKNSSFYIPICVYMSYTIILSYYAQLHWMQ